MFKSDTKVIFPSGAVKGRSKILLCKPDAQNANKSFVFVDETPFHPIDHYWPDQPSDKGWLVVEGVKFDICICYTAAYHKETSELLMGEDAGQIKRNDSNWCFLVAHQVVDEGKILQSSLEKEAGLEVDSSYRSALSAGHTASHFAALALNLASSSFWKKKVINDSLNNFDLDKLAIQKSTIEENASIDLYRFGKSSKERALKQYDFFHKSVRLKMR
jgi:alanyl-tRNA synthetase